MSERIQSTDTAPEFSALLKTIEQLRQSQESLSKFTIKVPKENALLFVKAAREQPDWHMVSLEFPDEGPCEEEGCDQIGLKVPNDGSLLSCSCPQKYDCGTHLLDYTAFYSHADHDCFPACCQSGHRRLEITENDFFSVIPSAEVWVEEELTPLNTEPSAYTYEVEYWYLTDEERHEVAKKQYYEYLQSDMMQNKRRREVFVRFRTHLAQLPFSLQDEMEVALDIRRIDEIDLSESQLLEMTQRLKQVVKTVEIDPATEIIIDDYCTALHDGVTPQLNGQLQIEGIDWHTF